MNAPSAPKSRIAVEIDAETLALVDKIVRADGRSVGEFAAEAIRRVAESESDYQAFVQEGIDALERGDMIPHDEVIAELEAMIANHRARCRE